MVDNKQTAISHIRDGIIDIKEWSEDLRSDKDLVTAAVRQDRNALQFVPKEVLLDVAIDSGTPSDVLSLLSVNSNDKIAEAVAKNPATLPETLEKMANDASKNVRAAAAGNPNTPSSALAQLANDEEYMVRLSSAGNPSLPSDLLELLASDPDKRVRDEVFANNPALLEEEIAYGVRLHDGSEMSVSEETEINAGRQALAGDHGTSPEVLDKLSEDPETEVRMSVAQHALTTPETLAKLAKDENPYVRSWVALNLNTSKKTLNDLSKDPDSCVRENVAYNPKTSPETLDKLANDPEVDVRVNVAQHEQTMPEILAKLANDESVYVRRGVALNPNTDKQTLKDLAKDPDEDVRENVAHNYKTDPETLKEFANDINYQYLVAGNESTPPFVLSLLSNNEDMSVRAAAASNPFTPEEVLVRLAADNTSVRSAVAGNENTPPAVLSQLALDDEYLVRLSAAGNEAINYKGIAHLTNDYDDRVRNEALKNTNLSKEMQMISYGQAHDTGSDVRSQTLSEAAIPEDPLLRADCRLSIDEITRTLEKASPNGGYYGNSFTDLTGLEHKLEFSSDKDGMTYRVDGVEVPAGVMLKQMYMIGEDNLKAISNDMHSYKEQVAEPRGTIIRPGREEI